jgi:hypothetical protein
LSLFFSATHTITTRLIDSSIPDFKIGIKRCSIDICCNEFSPRDDIDWEMNRMSIPEPKVEHHEGRGIRSCPIFPELRPILDEAFEIFGDKSKYVVAAPKYRAAANTAMGWKNANLRSEMTRLLCRAGVSGWPRLFHS